MQNKIGKDIQLKVLSTAPADTPASFTATTTGAQTVSFGNLTLAQPTVVDWGDGQQDIYTGAGARSHAYAGAGTWTIKVMTPKTVTEMDLTHFRMTSVLGSEVSKFVNLITLRMLGLAGASWAINRQTPLPPRLTTLAFDFMPGVSWTIDPIVPLPNGMINVTFTYMDNVFWTTGANAPIPPDLTGIYIVASPNVVIGDTLELCRKVTTVRVENNLTDAAQKTILTKLYAAFPNKEVAGGIVDLFGTGNALSGGTSQAACPPTTTREYGYELVNDSCGVSPNHWASVTLRTS